MYDKELAVIAKQARDADMAAYEADYQACKMQEYIENCDAFQHWFKARGHHVYAELSAELNCRPSSVPSRRVILKFLEELQ